MYTQYISYFIYRLSINIHQITINIALNISIMNKSRLINLLFFIIYLMIFMIGVEDVIFQLGIHNPKVILDSVWSKQLNPYIADGFVLLGGFWGSFWSLKKTIDPQDTIKYSNYEAKEVKMTIIK